MKALRCLGDRKGGRGQVVAGKEELFLLAGGAFLRVKGDEASCCKSSCGIGILILLIQ